MHAIAYRLLAIAVVAALAGWGGYHMGAKVERADWLELDQQRAHATAEAGRIAARAEAQRTAAAQAERDRLARRIQALTHAAARDRTPATECRISDAEQRLLDAELDAYRAAHAAAARALPGAVPANAGSDNPQHHQPARPAQPPGVGDGLPDAAGRVHRLDQ